MGSNDSDPMRREKTRRDNTYLVLASGVRQSSETFERPSYSSDR